MPPMTAMRRASTLMVGAMFAVVFVCGGVSTRHTASSAGDPAVSAHAVTSKVVVRASHQGVKIARPSAAHQLTSTGPTTIGLISRSPLRTEDAASSIHHPVPTITTSDRAPPAL